MRRALAFAFAVVFASIAPAAWAPRVLAQEAPLAAGVEVRIDKRPVDRDAGPIAVECTLVGPPGVEVEVRLEASVDDGRSFWPAARATTAARATRVRLASAAEPHALAWDVDADLVGVAEPHVRLRVVTSCGLNGAAVEQSAVTEVFSVAARARPGRARLVRHPYVQDVRDGGATIVWITDRAAKGAVQVLAADGGAAERVVRSPAGRARRHEVRIDGLAPGGDVRYRVLADDDAPLGPPERFRMAREPGQGAFRVAILGDSGRANDRQRKVAEQMRRAAPEVLLHTGDVIYPSGEAEDFDPKFFAPYREVLRQAPAFPSLGNHDIYSGLGAPYLEAFVLPKNNPARTERYYSFDWGDARFLALDTALGVVVPGTAQVRWLEAELARPRPAFTIAYFHHPPYSAGEHGSNRVVRRVFARLLERAGVDLVLSGHDHDYQRSRPQREYGGPGTVYVVTGGGGASLRPAGRERFTAVSASVHHFVLLEIDGAELRGRAIDLDGAEVDAFTLPRR